MDIVESNTLPDDDRSRDDILAENVKLKARITELEEEVEEMHYELIESHERECFLQA